MSVPRQIIPGRVYMVTRRCTQRQFLLRPDAATTNAFVYCLAFAAEQCNMDVVAYLAHSNHHHTIVVDRDARMPEFLERFHKLFAKHQNALRGRWENFWASEATSVVELPDRDDVLAKMTYALTNPVKDHLVERARHWPGASSLHANLDGRVLRASRPPRFFRREGKLPESVTLECIRPPGFEKLPHRAWQALLASKIREVEATAALARASRGFRILGRARVLRQCPTDRPASREPRRQLSPRVASLNKWARIEALRRNKTFIAAYQHARILWQAGLDAIFPVGTYWLRRFAAVPVAQDPAPA
jgi:putative transposase